MSNDLIKRCQKFLRDCGNSYGKPAATLISDCCQQLAWLQSQVIVIEEGEKIQAGDVIQRKDGNNFYWVTQEAADIENAEYLRKRWNAEIIRRICPKDNVLKPVVVRTKQGE